MSANPDPLSSTITTVALPFSTLSVVTWHSEANGASSQAFWMSSLIRSHGSLPQFRDFSPSESISNHC